jgi:hypothetical protein
MHLLGFLSIPNSVAHREILKSSSLAKRGTEASLPSALGKGTVVQALFTPHLASPSQSLDISEIESYSNADGRKVQDRGS